jgi:deoxyribodipyrimidine photo-lyase
MLQVVWFKRDLRICDHAPLAAAARLGPVLPLYIAEPGYWALPDVSARQWGVIREGLIELRAALSALGQPLVIRQGDVVTLLARLHAQYGIAHLRSHEETGNDWTFTRDKAVAAFCRAEGIPWTEYRQFGVIRGLKDRDRWASAFEAVIHAPVVSPPLALPPLDTIDPGIIPDAPDLGLAEDPCAARQPGGRQAGLDLLDSFFAGRGRSYSARMSSPATAAESCSRLSVHLATGTLSMREVIQRCYRERSRITALPPEDRDIDLRAIDSFIARLHWHCHFIQKLESEPALEWRSQNRVHEAHRHTTSQDDPRLLAWITGRTGFPFVDACMRSLIATGWINFRMRAMLMAFASYHLALDWRATGIRLARHFTDYEPGIHWPQVQMQSGQTGINTPRIYNPVKQGLDQDPEGIFTRRWLPELADVPQTHLHEPWRMDLETQRRAGCMLGVDYPLPLVDHVIAAREARGRLTAIRALAGYRDESQRVFRKHGSRKKRTASARKPKPRPADEPRKSTGEASRPAKPNASDRQKARSEQFKLDFDNQA